MHVGIGLAIREASEEDVDEIASVINEANYHAYRNIVPEPYFRYPVVTPSEILNDMKRMKFYVYEVDEKIVGVAALEIVTNDVGWIRWVYVHPRYQGKGIGTALMKHVEKVARSLGLKRLRLLTHEKAVWAIRFYEKLGFRIVDYIQRIAWRDVVMEKEL